MSKSLTRIVALLLVSCLAADATGAPGIAGFFSSAGQGSSAHRIIPARCQQEAFIPRALFHAHDYAPKIRRLVNALYDLALPPEARRSLAGRREKLAVLGPTSGRLRHRHEMTDYRQLANDENPLSSGGREPPTVDALKASVKRRFKPEEFETLEKIIEENARLTDRLPLWFVLAEAAKSKQGGIAEFEKFLKKTSDEEVRQIEALYDHYVARFGSGTTKLFWRMIIDRDEKLSYSRIDEIMGWSDLEAEKAIPRFIEGYPGLLFHAGLKQAAARARQRGISPRQILLALHHMASTQVQPDAGKMRAMHDTVFKPLRTQFPLGDYSVKALEGARKQWIHQFTQVPLPIRLDFDHGFRLFVMTEALDIRNEILVLAETLQDYPLAIEILDNILILISWAERQPGERFDEREVSQLLKSLATELLSCTAQLMASPVDQIFKLEKEKENNEPVIDPSGESIVPEAKEAIATFPAMDRAFKWAGEEMARPYREMLPGRMLIIDFVSRHLHARGELEEEWGILKQTVESIEELGVQEELEVNLFLSVVLDYLTRAQARNDLPTIRRTLPLLRQLVDKTSASLAILPEHRLTASSRRTVSGEIFELMRRVCFFALLSADWSTAEAVIKELQERYLTPDFPRRDEAEAMIRYAQGVVDSERSFQGITDNDLTKSVPAEEIQRHAEGITVLTHETRLGFLAVAGLIQFVRRTVHVAPDIARMLASAIYQGLLARDTDTDPEQRKIFRRLRALAGFLLAQDDQRVWRNIREDLEEALRLSLPGFTGDIEWWLAFIPAQTEDEMKTHLLRYLEQAASTGLTYADVILPVFSWKDMSQEAVDRVGRLLMDIFVDPALPVELTYGALVALSVPRSDVVERILTEKLNDPSLSPDQRERAAEALATAQENARSASPFEQRHLPVIVERFLSRWAQTRPTLDDTTYMLDHLLAPLLRFPAIYIVFRTLQKDPRLKESKMAEVRRVIDAKLTDSAAPAAFGEIQTKMDALEQARAQWRFADGVTLCQEMSRRDRAVAAALAPALKSMEILAAAWNSYQSGQDAEARAIINGSTDPAAAKLSGRIKSFEKVLSLREADRFPLARDEAQKLLDEAPHDGRVKNFLAEIEHLTAEKAEVRRLIDAGELDEARDCLERILENYPNHRDALLLKWELAQAYLDQGRRRLDPLKPLISIDSFQTAGELAEDLLTHPNPVFSKEPPAWKGNGGTNGKKKKHHASNGTSDPGGVGEFTEKNVRRAAAIAAARASLQVLTLHHAMLNDIVEAELKKITRLGGREGTLRLKYWDLEPTDRGFQLERLALSLPFPDIFLEGEIFQLYDDWSQIASAAFYQVVNVENRSVTFERVEEEILENQETGAPASVLPADGFIERVPNWSTMNQRDLLKQLKDKLSSTLSAMENSGSRDFPTTGYPLIDQYLGLPLLGAAPPIPMVLGPGGTGKTTGVLVPAIRRLLSVYDRAYSTVSREFKTPEFALDQSQADAVESILKLVEGRPQNKPLKILVVSQSHGAVDRVALRLQKDGIPFIRVGSRDDKMHKDIAKEYWATREYLIDQAYEGYQAGRCVIVLGTNNGFSTDPLIRKNGFLKDFDLVIMEESGKATVAETLLPLRVAKRSAQIGDHRQLRPFGLKKEEIEQAIKELGDTPARKALYNRRHQEHFGVSPFETIFDSNQPGYKRSYLDVNRRSHPWLVDNVVRIFYEFIKPDPAKDPRPTPKTFVLRDVPWAMHRNDNQMGSKSWTNLKEVNAVLQEMDKVLGEKTNGAFQWAPEQINVITFYQDQVDAIYSALWARAALYELSHGGTISQNDMANLARDLELLSGSSNRDRIRSLLDQFKLYKKPESLRALSALSPVFLGVSEGTRVLTLEELKKLPLLVATADSFQGHENDVIFASFVRSNDRGDIGFINNFNRLNVAMTRMRHRLIVIGDFSKTLTRARYRKKLNVSDEEAIREDQRWEETENARKIFTALYQLPAKLRKALSAGNGPAGMQALAVVGSSDVLWTAHPAATLIVYALIGWYHREPLLDGVHRLAHAVGRALGRETDVRAARRDPLMESRHALPAARRSRFEKPRTGTPRDSEPSRSVKQAIETIVRNSATGDAVEFSFKQLMDAIDPSGIPPGKGNKPLEYRVQLLMNSWINRESNVNGGRLIRPRTGQAGYALEKRKSYIWLKSGTPPPERPAPEILKKPSEAVDSDARRRQLLNRIGENFAAGRKLFDKPGASRRQYAPPLEDILLDLIRLKDLDEDAFRRDNERPLNEFNRSLLAAEIAIRNFLSRRHDVKTVLMDRLDAELSLLRKSDRKPPRADLILGPYLETIRRSPGDPRFWSLVVGNVFLEEVIFRAFLQGSLGHAGSLAGLWQHPGPALLWGAVWGIGGFALLHEAALKIWPAPGYKTGFIGRVVRGPLYAAAFIGGGLPAAFLLHLLVDLILMTDPHPRKTPSLSTAA